MKTLEVGKNPDGIGINFNTNMVYVSNTGSNTVSVIDGSTDEIIKTIPVNYNISPELSNAALEDLPPTLKFPNLATFIGVNSLTNSIYVTNPGSNTLSAINGTTNELLVGIGFTINPPDSGNIYCNGQNIQTNYIRYNFDAKVSCEAVPNDGFIFSSWSKGNLSTSPANPLLFTANEYGNLAVSFGQSLSLNEWTGIAVAYLAILAPISTIISLITLGIKRKQKQLFDKNFKKSIALA